MNNFLQQIVDSHSGELNEVIGYSDFDLIINTDLNKDHHKHLIRIAEGTGPPAGLSNLPEGGRKGESEEDWRGGGLRGSSRNWFRL